MLDFIEENIPPDSPLFPTRHGNLGKWRLKSSEKALKNQGFFTLANMGQERRALQIRQDSPPGVFLDGKSDCKAHFFARIANPASLPGAPPQAPLVRGTGGSSVQLSARLRRFRECRRHREFPRERSAVSSQPASRCERRV